MKERFFDFEVFPHWWLCVFGDAPSDYDTLNENIKDTFTYVTSDMPCARDKLLQYFYEADTVCIGYNIKNYDLPIANAIYQGFTPEQVKIVNDIIINPHSAYDTKEGIRMIPFAKRRLPKVIYQDLMNDSDSSLKQKECVFGLNILESSVPFNKEDLTEADKADIIYYCKHDVYASMYFYKQLVLPYTRTKLAMGVKFNIPEAVCRKSTNAQLVSIALGAKRTAFIDENRVDIELPASIKTYCYDNVPYDILHHLLTSKEGLTVKLFDNIVSYGNGGIHSVAYDGSLYVESNDDYTLVNVDATSYYPSMLIKFNCLSRCVSNPQIFTDIFNERVELKHKVNKTKEDEEAQRADKLVLNTTYGASGNEYLDLYDPYQCTKTCRLGQIFLTALACKIHTKMPYAKIIQTNTDGILVYTRRKDLDILDMLMREWTNISGIDMERDEVSKIWQRDVNNYLLVKANGKVKNKGAWLNDSPLRAGTVKVGALTAFVSAKAVQQYLLNGTDIVESIVGNNNLSDFAITCTKGPTYSAVVQTFADGTEQQLYKCNRVYASKDTNLGMIYKIKKYKDNLSYAKMPLVPEHSRLINEDLNNYDFKGIKKDIDYMYYINKAADLLDMQWVELVDGSFKISNKFDYFS